MFAVLTSIFIMLVKQLVNQNQVKQLQSSPANMEEKETELFVMRSQYSKIIQNCFFIHVEGIWYYYILSLLIV